MYTKTTAAFLLAAACTADSALAFAPSDAGALARSQAGLQCQAKSSRPSTTVSGALPLAPSKASGVTALSMQAWGQAEDAAAVLARVAQAESGGSASYSAPAAPSYSAPAPAQSSNDVADVLARVAAMNGGGAPPAPAPPIISWNAQRVTPERAHSAGHGARCVRPASPPHLPLRFATRSNYSTPRSPWNPPPSPRLSSALLTRTSSASSLASRTTALSPPSPSSAPSKPPAPAPPPTSGSGERANSSSLS
mmetsp:Transcript_34920/g.84984  ORF Transcript_34920/g.84984 Transcript_34920/m.84984 type:complete len:251 (+) Transcript_34920:79-831(+)